MAEEEEGREEILVQEGIRAGIARWEEEMTVEVVVLVVEEEQEDKGTELAKVDEKEGQHSGCETGGWSPGGGETITDQEDAGSQEPGDKNNYFLILI